MPTRQVSNGNVTVWWVTSIANPAAPTAAEINAGLNLSEAIAWNNFELGSSGSDDVDDRAITDVGNAISRGFPDFSATLDFFREANAADSASIYQQAFELFKESGILGYLVVRYGQAAPDTVAVAGQIVSDYYFVTDYVADDTEGDDSVKFEVSFLPQGTLNEHVVIKTATPVVATPATVTLAAGALASITALVGGKNMSAAVDYSSSDTTKATVSSTGLIKAIATGSATITVSSAGATGTDTVVVTIS